MAKPDLDAIRRRCEAAKTIMMCGYLTEHFTPMECKEGQYNQCYHLECYGNGKLIVNYNNISKNDIYTLLDYIAKLEKSLDGDNND